MTTLPILTKDWRVSFEFSPKNYNYKGYAQILHITTGGKYGNIGDRSPALWIHNSRGVYISTTLSDTVTMITVIPSMATVATTTSIMIAG